MRNWFDLIAPHEDIRKGHFDESVFAADLGDVAAGRAKPDYQDPYAFYRKTYLTRALSVLLEKVHAKLSKGEGPAVVQLQTPFGGGKTHALVLVWHYLTNGEEIAELLPEGVAPLDAHVAAVVGTGFDPLQGRDTDGVHRQTLWGELLYQLGGPEAYRAVEEHDRQRVAPGKDVLHPVLERLQPFTILLDELLEYVVGARSVEAGDETLGAQTLKFLKALTDTVAVLDRGLVVATLPSSELEDFGDAEQHNLAQLEKVFGRVESIETPVEGEEVYSIIRRRLFDEVKDEAAVRAVVDAYVSTYAEHRDELPQKVRSADYRRKMVLAYPFHPDVVDILYEKWGTFPSFQRTRGVLRLLANVVEDLYQRETNLDLILPGDISLERSTIRQEFVKHIGSQYESVIGSDVAGTEAKSQALDEDNRGWKHLAERNATAVFLHSFTADKAHAGATLPYVKLAVVRPETIPSLVTDVLEKQKKELWYLSTRGDEVYFSNVPNLNRMKLDRMVQQSPAAVREELEKRVKRELGTQLSCIAWPRSGESVSDNTLLKLVVVDPEGETDPERLKGWIERRGEGFRVYKNTLFFALPDTQTYARIADAVRELLALQEIEPEIARDERPAMQEKRAEVKRRIRELEEGFPLKVRELYRTAAVPRANGELETVDLGQPAVGRQNLDSWYTAELADPSRGDILRQPPSPRYLQTKFLGVGEPVSLDKVLEQFYKDPGLPALPDPSLLSEAVAAGVQNGTFGLGHQGADGVVPASVRFEESVASSAITLTEDDVLLPAETAEALKKEAKAAQPELPLGDGPGGTLEPEVDTANATATPSPSIAEVPPQNLKSYQRLDLRFSGVRVSQIADLNRGVFRPLTQAAGDFALTIELKVEAKDGIQRAVIEQQVLETLRQLGAHIERLEKK
ncbi:MAG: DUF499 domain-containing protein [Rhodothermales bacterium]